LDHWQKLISFFFIIENYSGTTCGNKVEI
jgi:hypothetical protein